MAPRRHPEASGAAPEHPNRALARRFWEAMAAGDSELVASTLSSDAVWLVHGEHPLAGKYEGPAKVLDFLARLGESVDELDSTLLDIYSSERGAVIRHRVRGRRGPKRLDNEIFTIVAVEAGRIVKGVVVPADQRISNEFWRLE